MFLTRSVFLNLPWRVFASFVLIFAFWGFQTRSINAQAAISGDVTLTATVGFAGQWKLGHVCPVRIDIAGPISKYQELSIEVQTIDGDGVDVLYHRQLSPKEQAEESGDVKRFWLPVRIGRQNTPLTVRLKSQANTVSERRIETSDLPPALPSTQPLILTLGTSLGVESASTTSVVDGTSSYSTCILHDAIELPDNWMSFASCDMIIIPTSDLVLLQSLRPAQWQAMDRWIKDGGTCLISLGRKARELTQIKEFQSLLGGVLTDIGRVTNPGPLESLVSTAKPIGDFEVVLLEKKRGVVDLQLSDTRNRRISWMNRHAYGLGIVQTIASDLDQPAFAQWEDRVKLWKLLLNRFLDRGSNDQSQRKSSIGDTSYLGYDDLVGQLRATLDVFPSIQSISFGLVAFALIVILILIGPVDYFFSIRVVKRPHVSWLFTGICLTLITIGLIVLRNKLRPDEVRVNTLQLIDIDVDGKDARGTLWSHVYSGSARLLSLDAVSSSSASPTENSGKSVALDWQGLPGSGLGGLLSQLNTDGAMPNYAIQWKPDHGTTIESVGVPAAGTKCISGVWHEPFEANSASNLKEIAGIDQLEGTLVNPLKVDLKECMLLYHNWFYNLPSRIPAGQTITISYETIPKDLPRRLNGRRVVEGTERITPWSPGDRDSLPRLLEMLMFYRAASGPSYTTLSHRYQPHLDLSNLLTLDCAILVGRIDQPWAKVQVSGEGVPNAQQELNQAWCRMIIPVQQNQRK